MTPERAAAVVSRWVRHYTRDLPPAVAGRRVEELDADVCDHIAFARWSGASDTRIAADVLSRMVRGLAADLSWRDDQRAKARPATSGGSMDTHAAIPPASSPRRPASVTVLAVLAALGGVGAVLGALAGAFLVHGLATMDASDVLIVTPALVLAAVYLALAYGAWKLRAWGWVAGLIAGVGSIVYTSVVLVTSWGELMRDAPPLAVFGVVVIVIAAIGLVVWFRPEVKAAFQRA
jgi:hypothetical protein